MQPGLRPSLKARPSLLDLIRHRSNSFSSQLEIQGQSRRGSTSSLSAVAYPLPSSPGPGLASPAVLDEGDSSPVRELPFAVQLTSSRTAHIAPATVPVPAPASPPVAPASATSLLPSSTPPSPIRLDAATVAALELPPNSPLSPSPSPPSPSTSSLLSSPQLLSSSFDRSSSTLQEQESTPATPSKMPSVRAPFIKVVASSAIQCAAVAGGSANRIAWILPHTMISSVADVDARNRKPTVLATTPFTMVRSYSLIATCIIAPMTGLLTYCAGKIYSISGSVDSSRYDKTSLDAVLTFL